MVGVAAFLAVEVFARIVLIPTHPSNAVVLAALAVRWLGFLALVAVWIPRFEKPDVPDAGDRRPTSRHVAVAISGYLLSMIPMSLVEYALVKLDLPSLQSLQPLLQSYSIVTLMGLTLTGAVLEEVFYRGDLIERVERWTGRTWPALVTSWLSFTLVHCGSWVDGSWVLGRRVLGRQVPGRSRRVGSTAPASPRLLSPPSPSSAQPPDSPSTAHSPSCSATSPPATTTSATPRW